MIFSRSIRNKFQILPLINWAFNCIHYIKREMKMEYQQSVGKELSRNGMLSFDCERNCDFGCSTNLLSGWSVVFETNSTNWMRNIVLDDNFNDFSSLATSKVFLSHRKGFLLTPEEGCGYAKVQNNRIIGGAPAKSGKLKIEFIFPLSLLYNFWIIWIWFSNFRKLAVDCAIVFRKKR